MSKRFLSLLTFLIFLSSSLMAERPALKIGAVLPLSGSVALLGEHSRQGIEMALEDIGVKGGVKVIYEDSGSSPAGAVAAYKKLVQSGGVDAILTLGSPMGMALSPLANKDEVILMSIAAAPAYSTPDDYTYRLTGSGIIEARFTDDYLRNKLGIKKVAGIYNENDYGAGTFKAFKKQFSGEIVSEESFSPGESDFRSLLMRIKRTDPEAIYVASWPDKVGLIVKQARQLGIRVPFICSQACNSVDVINSGGKAVEGLTSVTCSFDADKEFLDRSQKLYGDDTPSHLILRMYDAIMILSHAEKSCGGNQKKGQGKGKCLKKEIDTLKDFKGLSYPITFDRNGDINDSFVAIQVQDGKFKRIAER